MELSFQTGSFGSSSFQETGGDPIKEPKMGGPLPDWHWEEGCVQTVGGYVEVLDVEVGRNEIMREC